MSRLISSFFIFLIVAVAIVASVSPVSAQPEDFTTWQAESYPAVADFPAGDWQIAADGLSVSQTANGQPTVFIAPFEAVGSTVEGTVRVDGEDDDFIGFIIGFSPGDSATDDADYLLADWKRSTQTFDFGDPSCTPQSTAPAGMALSHVTGVPTADEFWGHTDFDAACSGLGTGLNELSRAATLGSAGWEPGQVYSFRFEVEENVVRLFANGILQFDEQTPVPAGNFAFYTFSQAVVTFADLTVTLPPPPTPEPTPDPCLGDLNEDGKINGRDVSIVARALPSEPGDKRWNEIADLNEDGRVSTADLHLVVDAKDEGNCPGHD